MTAPGRQLASHRATASNSRSDRGAAAPSALTLCHFQHFNLLLGGGAHFLNRGQNGRQRLHQSLFQPLLNLAGRRTGPSTVIRRTHACCAYSRPQPRERDPVHAATAAAEAAAGSREEHRATGRRPKRANAWKPGGGASHQEAHFVVRFGPRVFFFNDVFCLGGLWRPLAERGIILLIHESPNLS